MKCLRDTLKVMRRSRKSNSIWRFIIGPTRMRNACMQAIRGTALYSPMEPIWRSIWRQRVCNFTVVYLSPNWLIIINSSNQTSVCLLYSHIKSRFNLHGIRFLESNDRVHLKTQYQNKLLSWFRWQICTTDQAKIAGSELHICDRCSFCRESSQQVRTAISPSEGLDEWLIKLTFQCSPRLPADFRSRYFHSSEI